MSTRRIDCFFYGLFMDARVLRQAGTEPSDFRRAWVADFALRIGQRATLVAHPGARAYGMLVALKHEDLERLYSAPGLEGYRPEAVIAHTFDDMPVPALCYNLADAPQVHERNPEYAGKLRDVLKNLGFPAEYLNAIE